MSLEKVNPGESIKASTINSLIDAAKGQNIPSQDSFIQTAIGPVYAKRESINPDSNLLYTQFLETCIAPDSSNNQRVYAYIGNPLDSTFTSHSNLKCNGQSCLFIASYDGSSLDIVTPKKMLVNDLSTSFDAKENFTGGTPAYYNGWYKTNITQDSNETHLTLYGHFFQLLKEGQTSLPAEQREPVTKNLFIITKESNPYQLSGTHTELNIFQDGQIYNEISSIEKTYVLGELNATSATSYWNLHHTGVIDDDSSKDSQPTNVNFDGVFIPNVQASLSTFQMTSADVAAANPDMTPDQLSAEIERVAGKDIVELYDFRSDKSIDPSEITANGIDSYDFVMRQKKNVSGRQREVVYYALSTLMDEVSAIVPDDSVQALKQHSIQYYPDTDSQIELYNFHDQDYNTDLTALTQGCAQFVVRNQWEDTNTTARVRYVPVGQVIVTPDSEGNVSKSIELNQENYNSRELRLYNFLSANEAYSNMSSKPTFKDLAEDGYSILIRDDDDGVGPQLKYFDLRYLSRYGDADIPAFGQSSIETGSSSNALSAPYFQLADFPNPSVVDFNFTLNYDGKAYHMTNNLSTAEDVQFVMRNALGGSKDVQYYDFTITAPKVGMSALTQEVINELTSSHCDCGPKWTYISAVIDDISAQVSSLSGEYWPQGGDSSTCYGSSIGNNRGSTVIDLDGASLDGVWSTGNNFYVGSDLYIQNGSVYGTDYYGISYNAGCSIYADGYLTLGNTTLTEAQLIQLLRLV